MTKGDLEQIRLDLKQGRATFDQFFALMEYVNELQKELDRAHEGHFKREAQPEGSTGMKTYWLYSSEGDGSAPDQIGGFVDAEEAEAIITELRAELDRAHGRLDDYVRGGPLDLCPRCHGEGGWSGLHGDWERCPSCFSLEHPERNC